MDKTDSTTVPASTDAPAKPRVGIIGVGHMGGAMAARLLSLGYTVFVNDIDSRREAQAVSLGAVACGTATGVGSSCDVVIVAVVDGAQVHEVLFGEHGAASTLPKSSAVMVCSTIAPDEAERTAMTLDYRGIEWLDAPMSGGPERAADGELSLMVACLAPVFQRHRVLIEALATRVFHLSERAGDGSRTQLVNNLMAAVNLAGAAEALALAERMGLSVMRTLAVVEQASGQSWIGSDRMRRAIQGDTAVRARTALLNKDAHLALGAAKDAGMGLAMGAAAASVFQRACDRGLASKDDASLFDLLRLEPSQPPATKP